MNYFSNFEDFCIVSIDKQGIQSSIHPNECISLGETISFTFPIKNTLNAPITILQPRIALCSRNAKGNMSEWEDVSVTDESVSWLPSEEDGIDAGEITKLHLFCTLKMTGQYKIIGFDFLLNGVVPITAIAYSRKDSEFTFNVHENCPCLNAELLRVPRVVLSGQVVKFALRLENVSSIVPITQVLVKHSAFFGFSAEFYSFHQSQEQQQQVYTVDNSLNEKEDYSLCESENILTRPLSQKGEWVEIPVWFRADRIATFAFEFKFIYFHNDFQREKTILLETASISSVKMNASLRTSTKDAINNFILKIQVKYFLLPNFL